MTGKRVDKQKGSHLIFPPNRGVVSYCHSMDPVSPRSTKGLTASIDFLAASVVNKLDSKPHPICVTY